MARLPTVEDMGQRRIPNASRPIATVSSAAASAPARALTRLGDTVSATADRIYDLETTAAATERDAYAADQIRELLYNPESGFLATNGRDAVDRSGQVLARLGQIRSESMKGLNPGARRKVEASLERRFGAAEQTVYTHTTAARQSWTTSASTARIESARQDALASPSMVADALRVVDATVLTRARQEGWSVEQTGLERTKARSAVYTDQIKLMAQQSPLRALAYLIENEGNMLPSEAQDLRATLQPMAAEERGRNLGRGLALGTVGSLAGDMAIYSSAITNIESGGDTGNPRAIGPVVNGHRAYGKHQVMDFNVGPWTKKWVGREMTPEEFLADEGAQDAVFAGEFGSYVKKYGDPVKAARAWFGFGESDGYTTGAEYERRFSAYVRAHRGDVRAQRPGTATLGMIGGVKPDGGVWQSFDASGDAHASQPEYKDYSQLFREYRFDPPNKHWIAVGERDGKTVYAAPDYARDESGVYISVSASDARDMAQQRGSLIPTRDEVRTLYGEAHQIPMPTSSDFGKPAGEGTSEEYTANVRARVSAIGLIEGIDPVVHGKEFFAESEAPAQSGVIDPIERIMSESDPLVRESALAEYQKMTRLEQDREAAAIKAAGDAAFQYIEGGGRMDALPVDIRKGLGREQMTALRAYERSKETGVPIETDPSVYLKLRQMAATDPAGFRQEDLHQYLGDLSEADWQEFVKLQTAPSSDEKRAAVSTLMTQAKRGLEAAGIDATPDAGSDDARIVSAFQTRIVKWQDDFIKRETRAPTQSEIMDYIDQETAKVFINTFTLNPFSSRARRQERRMMGIDFNGSTFTTEDDLSIERFDELVGSGNIAIRGVTVEPGHVLTVIDALKEAGIADPGLEDIMHGLEKLYR